MILAKTKLYQYVTLQKDLQRYMSKNVVMTMSFYISSIYCSSHLGICLELSISNMFFTFCSVLRLFSASFSQCFLKFNITKKPLFKLTLHKKHLYTLKMILGKRPKYQYKNEF